MLLTFYIGENIADPNLYIQMKKEKKKKKSFFFFFSECT